MNLFILTNSDGSPIADKTVAAVTSVTDSTALDDLGNVVLGDSEPITLKFTTGTAAPSFAGDATYTPSLTIGAVTPDGSISLATAGTFSVTTGGWTGRIALTGTNLVGTTETLGGGWFLQQFGAGPRGAWLTLQVRVTNPAGNMVTYALLPVYVEWRVAA